MQTILDSPVAGTTNHSGYAGFWVRFVAVIIDSLVIGIPIWLLLFSGLLPINFTNPASDMGAYMGFQVLCLLLAWLYEAFMVSSENQATLGKMALGLKVTDLNGERLSFLRATGRHFAKTISYVILFVGFIMVAFTEKKQGLHDLIASTLVVKK